MGWELGRERRCQRPLPGGEGRPLGKGAGKPGSGERAALTYLVHVRSIFQALSLLSERCSPGSGSSLGKRKALPTDVQRKEQQPLPPQRPRSLRVCDERTQLPAFSENRLDVAEPPANGATGTREGLFSVGSWTWSGAAPRAVLGAGARGSAG